MNFLELLSQPWPWYISGPLIGLMVPALLLMGNKNFGISSSLRHICAACLPAKIPFFQYNWKREMWNLFFVAGVLMGGFVAATLFANPAAVQVNPKLAEEYAKQFADLPLSTQLSVMRRRKWLSQKALAKTLKVKQSHVARMERSTHDPRLSSVVSQARALHCHLMVVPDELLAKVVRAGL